MRPGIAEAGQCWAGGTAPASGTGDVVARLGSITVSATALRAPVGVYYQRVSVGEIPDLAGCGGDIPPPGAWWTTHAPNANGNFCFEVTLSYRRLERGR